VASILVVVASAIGGVERDLALTPQLPWATMLAIGSVLD
jgi:hypothetical protein